MIKKIAYIHQNSLDRIRIIPVLLFMFFSSIAFSGCSQKSESDSFAMLTLQETPQTYVLSSSDEKEALILMPDDGDTLTLKSARLGFTKIGSVYTYRANARYLENFHEVSGKDLTVEILRDWIQNNKHMTFTDLNDYAHHEVYPDYRIFNIEDAYTLKMTLSADGKLICTVERNTDGECFPLHLNGSTGYIFDAFIGLTHIPEYKTQKWLDHLESPEYIWKQNLEELTIPEFPGVIFKWTGLQVNVEDQELIYDMPILNVYLSDLTNDGKPEICTTRSIGSGFIDTRVVVYDYVKKETYSLQNRFHHDYYLSMQNEKLMVTQIAYGEPSLTTELRLINGEINNF